MTLHLTVVLLDIHTECGSPCQIFDCHSLCSPFDCDTPWLYKILIDTLPKSPLDTGLSDALIMTLPGSYFACCTPF